MVVEPEKADMNSGSWLVGKECPQTRQETQNIAETRKGQADLLNVDSGQCA
jgi:hypothetical protein